MSSFIKQILLVLLLLGLSSSFCLAQKVQPLQFEHITQEQGLSQSNVVTIHQDYKGFMWFGTRNGLNKYDGYEITVYQNDINDSTSISGNDVRDILEDRDGNLWVATFSGLNRYNREKDNFTHYTEGTHSYDLTNNLITCLYEDTDGNLWVGTDNGLNRIDREQGTVTQYLPDPDEPASLSDDNILSISEDSEGNLWVGTYHGLNKLDRETGKFQTYFFKPVDAVGPNRVEALLLDSRGRLWVGTQGGGLARYHPETDDFTRYLHDPGDPSSISHNVILSLAEDKTGRLWIGTENGGLNILDVNSGRFSVYRQNNFDDESLGSNSIYSIFRDNRDNMWVGTYSGGVDFYDNNAKNFVHYRTLVNNPNSLNDNKVEAIDQDSKGNIWLGTDGGGVNKFNPQTGEFTHFTHEPGNPNSLSGNHLLDLMVDSHDRVWAGTWGKGVSVYDPSKGTFTNYRHDPDDPNSLSLDNVIDIFEDSRGDIWISTVGGGLNFLDRKTGDFTIYKAPPEGLRDSTTVTNDYLVATYEDRKGNIWIGTEAVGLYMYSRETGVFSHFEQDEDDPNSLRGKKVFDFLHDSRGRLWICTDKGLNQFYYRDSTFTAFTRENGLPSNMITSILEDDHGNLWLGTNKGLSKFTPGDTTFSNFGPSDDLQGNDFNANAAFETENGRMYFGGSNGFNVFHPDSIRRNSYVPPVVITDFKIFNKSVGIGKDSELQKQITETDRITLSHKQSIFSFEFAALSYTGTEKNEYAYKMEGFDKQWHYVGTKRTATYTNLNPGEYTFRVKASNNDGVWNEQGTELAMVITPPFWQTNWFYIISALFIAGVVFTSYRWKVRSIRQQNADLETKVAERTFELNEKNEHLEDALKELKETRSQLVDKAHKAGMADVATGVLHNVGNILNSINVSTSVIDDTLRNTRLGNLKQANEMLRDNLDDIENFIVNNPKGELLLEYYMKVEEPLEKEYEILKKQKDRLKEKVSLITEVIAAQQDFSKVEVVKENTDIQEVCEDALTLQAGSIQRHDLIIEKDYELVDSVAIEKTKVMHILFNLFKNAKESMKQADVEDRIMNVSCRQDDDYVHLSVSDNGIGISEEELNKIFTHGFTTKKQGHGFGLHSCANSMKEMGGKIRVDSDGLGEGATFTLSFPREREPEGTPQKNGYSELQKTEEKGTAELKNGLSNTNGK